MDVIGANRLDLCEARFAASLLSKAPTPFVERDARTSGLAFKDRPGPMDADQGFRFTVPAGLMFPDRHELWRCYRGPTLLQDVVDVLRKGQTETLAHALHLSANAVNPHERILFTTWAGGTLPGGDADLFVASFTVRLHAKGS